MADIKKELNDIKNAVYGREVRGSIHDGIKKINDEVENATDLSESAKHQVENIQQQVNQLVVEGDSSVEAAQARVTADGKVYDTLRDRLNSIDEQLVQNAVDVDVFVGDSLDATQGIQQAIDKVHSDGSGRVIITKKYNTYSSIHVKEGVTLLFAGGSINYKGTSGSVIIVHRNAKIKDPSIFVESDYNDSVILISTEFLYHNHLSEISNVYIRKPSINPTTTNCTGIKFFADTGGAATSSGFSYITIDNVFMYGINNLVHFETKNTGWITSCFLNNFKAAEFQHAVIVDQSNDSLGIHSNVLDNFHLQTSSHTREIFIDEESNNTYKNFKIWDMHSHPNASYGRVGGNLIDYINRRNNKPTYLLSNLYSSHGYRHLGFFKKLNSLTAFATFRLRSQLENIDSEFTITYDHRVKNDVIVRRKHYGNPINNNRLKFFIIRRENGNVDLYIKTSTDFDGHLMLEAYSLFTVAGELTTFNNLEGLTEIVENEGFSLDYKPIVKVAKTKTTALPMNTYQITEFHSQLIDVHDGFKISQPTRLTCEEDGVYSVSGRVRFSEDSSLKRVYISINGHYNISEPIIESSSRVINFNDLITLNKGDYIELVVFSVDKDIDYIRAEFSYTKESSI